MFNAWHHVKTLFLTLKFVVNGSFLLHVILLFFLNFFCVFGFIGIIRLGTLVKMIVKFLNLNYKFLQCFIMDRNSLSLFLVWCLLYNLT